MVVDNGSNTESLAKSTTHKLEENTFFGGGFNIVLDYFLSTNHEYLYFLYPLCLKILEDQRLSQLYFDIHLT